jgi:diguanylate cyclase (GGDEF)-like protein
MPHRPTVRRYCALVSLVGCATVALLAVTIPLDLRYITRHPLSFGFLSAGVLLGEMLPVKIPRRGDDEEIVLSTSFSLALLMAGGLGPALIVQSAASAIQDLLSGRPLWRIRFNLGQYALSLAAALMVMRLLSEPSRIGSSHPFTTAELPVVLLSAAVFFVVNSGLVGVGVALYQGRPIGRYLGDGPLFVLSTGSVMLFLAPIIIAAAAYSVLLIPLFVGPMLAIYFAGRESARSEHAARHDALTGLPNRTAFRDTVRRAVQDGGPSAGVLLMDLDRFKEINDTLGHRYGDMLLCQVSERLAKLLAQEDEFARLGGDEFAIFGRGRSVEASVELARSIAGALRSPFELEHFVVDAQASVGIALFPADGADVETLLQKADVAMYRAKQTHSGAARYDERHDNHSPARLALTADLRSALDSDEIVAWFQPLLSLNSGAIPAVEALVRWNHPERGILAPGAFLDLAERTNLIKPLTQRVLQLALRQVAEWRALGMDIAVAVNVSARVLIDGGFPDHVAAALDLARVPPGHLKLEVTESALMADPEIARTVLRRLDDLGIEISIDDFGTGYSSLAYLADLPVSEVKIDRSFVSRMATGPRDAIIVSSTVDLAHHLGLRAVAEGVEDAALLVDLRELGCDAAQGYAISRPLPGPEATRWLLEAHSAAPTDGSVRTAA